MKSDSQYLISLICTYSTPFHYTQLRLTQSQTEIKAKKLSKILYRNATKFY